MGAADFHFVFAAIGRQAEPLDSYASLTGGQLLWQVFLLGFFILLNGFFVSAEFALVKVRSSQLDPEVEKGRGSAILAQHIVRRLEAYLSACQLGIAVSSIVLGSVSVPFISLMLQPLLGMTAIGEGWIRTISFLLGISVITFLHVVIGEQMPKVLAIRKALRISLISSRPLHTFYLLFKWPIWLVNACAGWLLRTFLKIEPVTGAHDVSHSPEELRILLEQPGGVGEVTETERDILKNALELNDLTVRDIMTPRNEVVSLDMQRSFEENLEIALETKHTRFPLVEGHLDRTVGLIHIKDLIAETRKPNPDLLAIRREILPVPELMPLDNLLKTFLARHAHLALVVDEFGGALGLVMLDDVLEELVGEIQDEFDEEEREFRRIGEDEFFVDGTFSLHDLAAETDLEMDSPDVSTIGGYVTHLMGRLPEVGEEIEIEGYFATITQADERSVQEVRFVRQKSEESADEEDEAGGED